MNIWKLNYNEKENRVEVVTFSVSRDFASDPYNSDEAPKTNIVEQDRGCFLGEAHAIRGSICENEMIQNGDLVYLKCKDCGRYFCLGNREKEWFQSRDMALPKRCTPCRKKKKQNLI